MAFLLLHSVFLNIELQAPELTGAAYSQSLVEYLGPHCFVCSISVCYLNVNLSKIVPFLSYSFSFDGLALVIGAAFHNYTQAIKVLIEQWRREYNRVRPHSSLGYRLPIPEARIPVTLT